MHVPIDDGDPRRAVTALGVTSGNRNVAVDAEPHSAVGHRVVARRADEGIGMMNRPSHYRIDGGYHTASREAGDRLTVRAHRGAGSGITPGVAHVFHALDVFGRVVEAEGAIADHLG